MKKITTLLLLCCAPHLFAQLPVISSVADGSTLNLTPWNSYTIEILSGNPYFNPEFESGKICIDNKWIDKLNLRYNSQFQSLEIKIDNKISGVSQYHVSAFEINHHLFENGFKAIEKQTEKSFYAVIYSGKSKVLKYIFTEAKNNKGMDDVVNGIDLVTYNSYYWANEKKELTRFLMIKNNFLSHLDSKKQDRVKSFMAEKNLKLKNDEELILVLKYYDSLEN